MIPLSESLAELETQMRADRAKAVEAHRRLKAEIERQLPTLGTLDPTMLLSAEDYATYRHAIDAVKTFEPWLRMQAWECGMKIMPRFEVVP